jgi:hypothetical protein
MVQMFREVELKSIHEINLIKSCDFGNLNSYGPLINEIVHKVEMQIAK